MRRTLSTAFCVSGMCFLSHTATQKIDTLRIDTTGWKGPRAAPPSSGETPRGTLIPRGGCALQSRLPLLGAETSTHDSVKQNSYPRRVGPALGLSSLPQHKQGQHNRQKGQHRYQTISQPRCVIRRQRPKQGNAQSNFGEGGHPKSNLLSPESLDVVHDCNRNCKSLKLVVRFLVNQTQSSVSCCFVILSLSFSLSLSLYLFLFISFSLSLSLYLFLFISFSLSLSLYLFFSRSHSLLGCCSWVFPNQDGALPPKFCPLQGVWFCDMIFLAPFCPFCPDKHASSKISASLPISLSSRSLSPCLSAPVFAKHFHLCLL